MIWQRLLVVVLTHIENATRYTVDVVVVLISAYIHTLHSYIHQYVIDLTWGRLNNDIGYTLYTQLDSLLLNIGLKIEKS